MSEWYPFEVFVATQALETARENLIWKSCYRLLRNDPDDHSKPGEIDGTNGWRCSHFYTQGPSVLTYHGFSRDSTNPHTQVTLQCSEEPIRLEDNTHNEQVTFTNGAGLELPMNYRCVISGYQIKRGYENPIKVVAGPQDVYQWCAQVRFLGAVFGQRLADKVWLETPYDVEVTINPPRVLQ